MRGTYKNGNDYFDTPCRGPRPPPTSIAHIFPTSIAHVFPVLMHLLIEQSRRKKKTAVHPCPTCHSALAGMTLYCHALPPAPSPVFMCIAPIIRLFRFDGILSTGDTRTRHLSQSELAFGACRCSIHMMLDHLVLRSRFSRAMNRGRCTRRWSERLILRGRQRRAGMLVQ